MNTILILDNIRSAQNVGAILRSASAFGAEKLIACGITPYPEITGDTRLPHVRKRANEQIAKTALGAHKHIKIEYAKTTYAAVNQYRKQGFKIYALEQAQNSVNISKWRPIFPCAIVLGSEVNGLSRRMLNLADQIVEIRSPGKKASLNVAVAAGIALFKARSQS